MRESDKLYCFFADPSGIDTVSGTIRLTGKDYNHIKNVLRLKEGEEVSIKALSSGSEAPDNKEYRCGIDKFLPEEESVLLKLRFIKEEEVELPVKIYLFQGIPKGDKLELVIQKAVELGAFEIVPVDMKRCVRRIEEKKREKFSGRYRLISEAAAKQAKRAIVPEVSDIMTVSRAISFCNEEKIDIRLLPYELCDHGTMERTREILKGIKRGQSIAVFIGPEGGFEEEEVLALKENGFEEITLGRRILRTETAGMTVISWLVFLLEA